MPGCAIPTPAPWAKRNSAFASLGRRSNPETLASLVGMMSFCASTAESGRSGLAHAVPARRQFERGLDVGGKINLTPLFALDVECPHVSRLCDLMDHSQIPDGRA